MEHGIYRPIISCFQFGYGCPSQSLTWSIFSAPRDTTATILLFNITGEETIATGTSAFQLVCVCVQNKERLKNPELITELTIRKVNWTLLNQQDAWKSRPSGLTTSSIVVCSIVKYHWFTRRANQWLDLTAIKSSLDKMDPSTRVIDFCHSELGTCFSCEGTVFEDNYGPSNLLSLEEASKTKGLRVETYVRPPVKITLTFKKPIHLSHVEFTSPFSQFIEIYGSG